VTAPPCDWELSAAAFDAHLDHLDALADATAWAEFHWQAARFLSLNDSDNRHGALDLYRTVLARLAGNIHDHATRTPAPAPQVWLTFDEWVRCATPAPSPYVQLTLTEAA
jgi:hypothetical protein